MKTFWVLTKKMKKSDEEEIRKISGIDSISFNCFFIDISTDEEGIKRNTSKKNTKHPGRTLARSDSRNMTKCDKFSKTIPFSNITALAATKPQSSHGLESLL